MQDIGEQEKRERERERSKARGRREVTWPLGGAMGVGKKKRRGSVACRWYWKPLQPQPQAALSSFTHQNVPGAQRTGSFPLYAGTAAFLRGVCKGLCCLPSALRGRYSSRRKIGNLLTQNALQFFGAEQQAYPLSQNLSLRPAM